MYPTYTPLSQPIVLRNTEPGWNDATLLLLKGPEQDRYWGVPLQAYRKTGKGYSGDAYVGDGGRQFYAQG